METTSSLPYFTLPFGAGVLPPSAEASSRPNAHPLINPKVIETFYRFLQTGGECCSVPVLGHLFLRNTFQRIHIVSERWHSSCLKDATTSSITMQSLGEIELRAPAIGAKIWCFVCHAWSACTWGT